MKLDIEWSPALSGGDAAGAEALLERVAEAACKAEGLTSALCAHLTLTDDETIRRINRDYREVDRATDVLSFPTVSYPAGQTAGACPGLIAREYDPDEDACFIGDIVISLPHARAQAAEFGHSPQRELAYLLTHGLFHLFGYDHMNEKDEKVMFDLQKKIVGRLP